MKGCCWKMSPCSSPRCQQKGLRRELCPWLTQKLLSRTLGFQAQPISCSLALPTLPQHFAVIQMKGHEHIRNILEKKIISLFFPSGFLAVGQRSTLGMSRFCDLIKPFVFLFKTSSRDLGSVVEDFNTNFPLVPWTIPVHPLGVKAGIFSQDLFSAFLPALSSCGRGEFCTGNSFYSPFTHLKMTLGSRKYKLRSRKGAGWGSSLWQMLLVQRQQQTELWGCSEGRADE